MKNRFAVPLHWAACIAPIALLGGLLVGIYTFEYYTEATRQLILQQVKSYPAFLGITTVQSLIYATVCAFLGAILVEKLGLMRPFCFTRPLLLRCGAVTLACGLLFALDAPVFGRLLPEVVAEYAKGITPACFFSALLYGGIIEEILLRWFFLSLIAFLLWKIFARSCSREEIPEWVFVAANVISALAFAAGHLPTTISLFGHLTPLIVFRCFLLNGFFGLVFGRFFQRYGIQYAMLGHFGLHLVSKLLLLL